MKYYVKGGSSVDLSQNNFVNAGGCGNVYAIGSTAYKIINDINHIIPEAKIQELSILKHNDIIKPDKVLLDNKNKTVGYTMRYVTDTYQLCQLFPKPFRARNNLTPDHVVKIVQRMQDIIDKEIHSKGILIVDLNENNFLISQNFNKSEVFFIDVDSYQTPHFPATAIMETIRDRHASHFSELSDWFSFAVISFQLFRGVHPYKGNHPIYADMDARMLHNISIMNSQVSYPKNTVLPEDVVPQAYRDWYRAVLDNGQRLKPPGGLIPLIIVQTQTRVKSGALFDIIELDLFKYHKLAGEVHTLIRSGNRLVCETSKCVYEDRLGRSADIEHCADYAVGFTQRGNIPFVAKIENGLLVIMNLDNGQILDNRNRAESLMEYDGRVYYKYEGNIFEIYFLESTTIRPLYHLINSVLPHATKLHKGCVVQNMLGSYFITTFPAHKQCKQFRAKELDGFTVVDARHDNGVLMVIRQKKGKYDRLVYKIDGALTTSITPVRIEEDVNYTGLNFVVLDHKVCVGLREDGAIEAFTPTSSISILKDNVVNDIMLMKDGTKAVFYNNNKFYQLRMK